MTKGGSSKPKTLGRLLFGDKRKQHSSPSQHRSATRNKSSAADIPSTYNKTNVVPSKSPINLHDWAAWRTQLNEHMGNGMTEKPDPRHVRQFLQSNSFYQQHSRDPSNGRYAGAKLMFSIPHARVQPELIDRSRPRTSLRNHSEIDDTLTYDQSNLRSNSSDPRATSVNSVSVGSSLLASKTMGHPLPKVLDSSKGDFLRINEPLPSIEPTRLRPTTRNSGCAADRVHSTLQKAVKDGNVLEKIKAFEMQAAAAQADSTAKIAGAINNRVQSITAAIQSATQRTLTPVTVHPIQHPISPMPLPPMQHHHLQHHQLQQQLQQQQQQQQQQHQQQTLPSHRNRRMDLVQYHNEGNSGPIMAQDSRKGAHVLEPAHGDIILKRRTHSRKNSNEDEYTTTMMSSTAVPSLHHHHSRSSRHHQSSHPSSHHHRSSASRSRHRHENDQGKRSPTYGEHTANKHLPKPKPVKVKDPSPPAKPSSRYRWLKGRKETPAEPAGDDVKPEKSPSKSKKSSKSKKKNNAEEEKAESAKQSTSSDLKDSAPLPSPSDNNRVYGVPNTSVEDRTKLDVNPPHPPSRIDEEPESEQPKEIVKSSSPPRVKEEQDEVPSKSRDATATNTVERRASNKKKQQQKLSSTDGEILSKADEDARFSRPTDDHAHRSELNEDEDDECKSEGDVFIEESSVRSTSVSNTPQQPEPTSLLRRRPSQCSTDGPAAERRWHWSKESGGLIDKGTRKGKVQPITIVTRSKKSKQEDTKHEPESLIYDMSTSEPTQTIVCRNQSIHKKRSHPTSLAADHDKNMNEANQSKNILHTLMNAVNKNDEPTKTRPSSGANDFFEQGPHSNPEETMANVHSPA